MRVAVLGAGNGGLASAFDFAQRRHEVSLFAHTEFGTNLGPIEQAGGIRATGDLEGFAPCATPGTTPAKRWTAPSWCSSSGRPTAPRRWPATRRRT